MQPRTALVSIALALAACGAEPAKRQLEPIRVRIVDDAGKPASWAQVLLKRSGKDVASKWDAARATLILPRESAPHAIRVTAEGRRLRYVNDIRDDRTVTLQRGPVVRIELANTAAEPPKPRTLLLRVRPWVAGDPDKDTAMSAKITLYCDLMWLVKGQEQGSLPRLPTKHWGFGITPVDARNGFYVPAPGSYVVQWGLLDLDEGTWYTADENASLRFEVKDQAGPQTFSLAVDEATMRVTDLGLQRRIDTIRAREAETAK